MASAALLAAVCAQPARASELSSDGGGSCAGTVKAGELQPSAKWPDLFSWCANADDTYLVVKNTADEESGYDVIVEVQGSPSFQANPASDYLTKLAGYPWSGSDRAIVAPGQTLTVRAGSGGVRLQQAILPDFAATVTSTVIRQVVDWAGDKATPEEFKAGKSFSDCLHDIRYNYDHANDEKGWQQIVSYYNQAKHCGEVMEAVKGESEPEDAAHEISEFIHSGQIESDISKLADDSGA